MDGIVRPIIPRHAVVLVANKPAFASHVAHHLVRCNPKRPIALVGKSTEASAYHALAQDLTRHETKAKFFPNDTNCTERVGSLYAAIQNYLGPPLAVIELSESIVNPTALGKGALLNIVARINDHLGRSLMPLARQYQYGRIFKLIWVDTKPSNDFQFRGGDFSHNFTLESAFSKMSDGRIRDLECMTSNPAFRKGFNFLQFGSAGGLLEWALTEGPSLFFATLMYATPECEAGGTIASRFPSD